MTSCSHSGLFAWARLGSNKTNTVSSTGPTLLRKQLHLMILVLIESSFPASATWQNPGTVLYICSYGPQTDRPLPCRLLIYFSSALRSFVKHIFTFTQHVVFKIFLNLFALIKKQWGASFRQCLNSWDRQKPEARNSFQVSHKCGRVTDIQTITCTLGSGTEIRAEIWTRNSKMECSHTAYLIIA